MPPARKPVLCSGNGMMPVSERTRRRRRRGVGAAAAAPPSHLCLLLLVLVLCFTTSVDAFLAHKRLDSRRSLTRHTKTLRLQATSEAPSSASSSSSPSGSEADESLAGQSPPKAPSMTIEDLVKSLYEADDPLWELLRFEAQTCATQDEQATTLLEEQVMRHDTLQDAAKNLLSTKLLTGHVSLSELDNLLNTVCDDDPSLEQHFREDLLACAMRDPSIPGILAAFLFSKGFHAVATYRVAHSLYTRDRQSLARFLQSVNSELFGADIHPACSVGRSLFLSSGSSIVIGETARLGDDVVVMQGVTLGGNGKEKGDRHPKIGSRVLLAPGATVLGNIPIGNGVIVNSCSVVVKAVPDFSRCSGVPAKVTSLGSSEEDKQTMLNPGHRSYIYIFSEACWS